MKRTAFSLIEILVAVIILAVLSSLSIVAYQKTLQANDERICQQNQKVLQAAIEVYTIENDAVPATLAMLNPRQINLAYLKVVGQPKENKLLAFLKNTLGIKPALAQTLPALGKYYNYDTKMLKCPADKSSTAISYKINTYDFIDKDDLKDPAKANIALVFDADAYHKKALSSEHYQIAVTPTGDYAQKDKNSGKTTLNATTPSSTTPISQSSVIIPTSPIAVSGGVINENLDQETVSSTSANRDTCCASKDSWRKFKKEFKKSCNDAGYKHPKKESNVEIPQGKCAN